MSNEQDKHTTVVNDPFSEFVEGMDRNLYAGHYCKDNITHLAATDTAKARNFLMKAKNANIDSVQIESAKFSYNQLESARDALFFQHNKLELVGVGLDPTNNGIIVFAPDISEGFKNAVAELSIVKNIQFEKADVFDSFQSEIENPSEPDSVERATTLRAGYYLYRKSGSDPWTTLGWRAKVNGNTGYLTCAHGWTKNSNAYYVSELIGTVSSTYFGYGGRLDFCFIPRSC